ncbi:MAG: hypothetical protein AAGF53_17855, partial [Pseudomonadota bacterium]
ATERRNQTTTGQIDDGVPAKVPTEAGEESALITEETQLSNTRHGLKSLHQERNDQKDHRVETRVDKTQRNVELRQLQTEFDRLKDEGVSTAKALRQVIDTANNLETKQHLRAILSKVTLLQSALPDKPEVVNRLLDQTGLNLAAATVAGSFADFLTAVDQDADLTKDDRATLHQIIKQETDYARTGLDVQAELGQTLTIPTGDTIPAHTETEPFRFREHVQGFANPDGSQHLRAVTITGAQVTLDITGWPPADVARASELLQLWAMTDQGGQSGYLETLTGLDWTEDQALDPLALHRASRIVGALLGRSANQDGAIFDGREAAGIIRWQTHLFNQTHSQRAVENGRDATGPFPALQNLGIVTQQGEVVWETLQRFGEYSRAHYTQPGNVRVVQKALQKDRHEP